MPNVANKDVDIKFQSLVEELNSNGANENEGAKCKSPVEEMKPNAVNHPAHYNKGGIECIEGIDASRGIFRTIAFCQCNAIKYLWRQGAKDNEMQEIEKAQWYLNRERNMLEVILRKGGDEAVKVYNTICALCDKLDELVKK